MKGNRLQVKNDQSWAQSPSLAHIKSKLTTVLAETAPVYKRIRYGRKHDLGLIHPMVLHMRQNAPFQSKESLRQKPKAMRIRLKLSTTLAVYIRCVTSTSAMDGHPLAKSKSDSINIVPLNAENVTPSIAQSRMEAQGQSELDTPGETESSRQDRTTVTELESLKQAAHHQPANIGQKHLTNLTARGYGLQDLAAWHWILSANTAIEATQRLATLMKPPVSLAHDFGPVPVFIFLRVLQRADISLWALHSLIEQAWNVLGSFDRRQMATQLPSTENPVRSIGLDELVIMVVRLLRHARTVWPASCIRIAKLWITYANLDRVTKRPKDDALTRRDFQRLSFAYNRILSLLSLPPHESPYQSLHHRQMAQFMVIRQMSAFNPQLTINRDGYRGVARVQLAHRKTHGERRWARLKAKAWPPWKEDKLGVDASVGVEHGVSRAFDSLRQMMEAGNRPLEWEQSAGILAGWDTDRSPTIQTRSATIPRSESGSSNVIRKATLSAEPGGLETDSEILWLARIKATRTLQEAWICFSACRDKMGALTPRVYQAMFEKLIYDEKRNRRSLQSNEKLSLRTDDQDPLPGDGKEVSESSSSHNQAVFTQEPIPTYDQLFTRMTDDQIQLPGPFLAFLLTHARTYDEGIQALQVSRLSDPVKRVLMPWKEPPTADVRSLLETLPDSLFAAHIGFLCRSGQIRDEILSMPHASRSFDSPAGKELYNAVLILRHAFKLVFRRMPFYRPPWNSLLESLSRPDTLIVIKKTPTEYRHARAIPKYRKARRLLEYMDSMGLDMDFAGFRSLYVTFREASRSARHALAASEDYDEKVAMHVLLDDGLAFIKARFSQLVKPVDGNDGDRMASSDASHPATANSSPALEDPATQWHTYSRLSNVPHPADLHAYARFLGQHPSYDDLAGLVQWISTNSEEVLEEARESSNGLAMMRTCLTAVRVILEQSLAEQHDHERAIADRGSPDENAIERLERVRNIIECNEDLGGWPADEEVEQYLYTGKQHGRRPSNKNAISKRLLQELSDEILQRHYEAGYEMKCFERTQQRAAMGKGTRAIIIGSEVDGVFCAGADLKERKDMTEEETKSFLDQLRKTLYTLSRLHIPTISAVSSVALGGGLELALATEFRVFTPSTIVGLPETRLGIIPGAGGVPRLKQLLGRTRAMDIILTGRRIRGEEAFRMGLCDRLCGPTLQDVQNDKIGDDVLRKSAMDCALEMAKQICEGGPATTAPLVRLMRLRGSETLFGEEPLAYEKVLKTQDRNEALRAFAEKRKPVFRGK
ncbi:MAG: hypothetical protein LQ348_005006 [Seirophora lacunosa]|nr:MAG: hypothetical protein LQ348_005006 [Seirophora lacunosa]